MTSTPALPDPVARLIDDARSDLRTVLVLTGAGISAESGVPTFRGKEGYWTVGSRHYMPEEMATQTMFQRDPDAVWAWYLYRRGVCRGAAPNAAHEAIAALQACAQSPDETPLLVTQNVDGLHRRAGSPDARTYTIHGNIDDMRCAVACSAHVYPIPEAVGAFERATFLDDQTRALLTCPRCGAPARPHVLWFDECYDETLFRFESSLQAARRATLLITVGSTGRTNLPNHVVATAARSGATHIDVNIDDNPFGRAAAANPRGYALQGTATSWVPRLVEAITRR